MNESSVKTPWHLWVVGIVAFLWNSIGALDYTATQLRVEAYMSQFSPEQLEYFYGFPSWAVACWAIAVWGSLLGSIGFLRIVMWQAVSPLYGEHYLRVAFTVAASLIGVVMFGSLAGSLLPFLFRRLGVDPASASAPFVATLVDVTGLLIYFAVASVILAGALL